ncbi:MAG: hypothetical protein H7315_03745, partial [Herminiimonas sp.]|nr:hypothetical protein [Herminiimonas sp.]
MKLNQKMFDKMRAATRSLMAGGPQSATAVIQRALQGSAAADTAPLKDAWKTGAHAGNANAASNGQSGLEPMSGFVADLLAKLKVQMPAEGMPFNTPPFAPQSTQATETAAATGG